MAHTVQEEVKFAKEKYLYRNGELLMKLLPADISKSIHTPGRNSFSLRFFLPLTLLVLLLFPLSSCTEKQQPNRLRSIPVSVAPVKLKNVPEQIRVIGNVEARSTVQVRAQVGGMLKEVHFQEGQFVRKGDPLFTIDTRPFDQSVAQSQAALEKEMALTRQARADYLSAQAAVRESSANVEKAGTQIKQTEATLERDQYQEKNARDQLERYSYLLEKGYTTREQFDKVRTDADSMKATLKADAEAVRNAKANYRASQATLANSSSALLSKKAAIEQYEAATKESGSTLAQSKILLGYCTINSPIDGKTGSLLIHRGNLVKADDANPLVVINEITPIDVSFSLPERDLPRVKAEMKEKRLKVAGYVQGETNPENGAITFIDNTVDTTTGTIKLKGTFPNINHRLWPGQYVNVIVTLRTLTNVATVPTRAVQSGQPGDFVYVLKTDTVEIRPVKAGIIYRDETVIEKGLSPGEQVVTDGQLRLTDGATVELKKLGSPTSREKKRT